MRIFILNESIKNIYPPFGLMNQMIIWNYYSESCPIYSQIDRSRNSLLSYSFIPPVGCSWIKGSFLSKVCSPCTIFLQFNYHQKLRSHSSDTYGSNHKYSPLKQTVTFHIPLQIPPTYLCNSCMRSKRQMSALCAIIKIHNHYIKIIVTLMFYTTSLEN